VGWVSVGNHTRAARWTAAGPELLGGPLQPADSRALGTNSDGSVIVGTYENGNRQGPFIWDAQLGMRDLTEELTGVYGVNLDLWTLHADACAISADGRVIVGNGFDHGVLRNRAWRVFLGWDCPADANHDGVLDSSDFFEFLARFFAGHADFNRDGTINSQDFFDYLTAYFAGCA
jgi:uncharacterized membrane protein